MTMNKKVKIGILLPTRGLLMQSEQPTDMGQIIDMAQNAERAGIDSVWVGDSLTAKPRLEPLTTLAALATTTSKVRLGTAVLLASLRHPVQLAHTATTVDFISGGRLILGMGVGGAFNEEQRSEWENLGINPIKRATRFEELLKIFKPLTRGETVTFEGEHFNVNNVSLKPVSPQANGVPVLVAAHGRSNLSRQYERVLLGDGSISISDSPSELKKSLDQISHHASNSLINYDDLEKTFYMTVNIGSSTESLIKESDDFLKRYYGINIWQERWGPWGSAQLVTQQMSKYVDMGANTIIVRFASFDQHKQLELFLDEVFPYWK